jgi:hypothetical protein
MIHEYRPNDKPQLAKPRSSWRSITTGISLSLDPIRLSDDLSGYEIKTLRQIISDMDADLQKLRADRSALMRSLTADAVNKQKISAEVARIDLNRAPMVRAWQIINSEIKTRKNVLPWPAVFVKVARKRLPPELMELLRAETTQLHDAMMNQ